MAICLLLSVVWAASQDPVREQYEEYQGFKRIECIENSYSYLEKH
jgi:hypothetical protein